eukprot:gene4150-7089_t
MAELAMDRDGAGDAAPATPAGDGAAAQAAAPGAPRAGEPGGG